MSQLCATEQEESDAIDRAIAFLLVMVTDGDSPETRLDWVVALHETLMNSATGSLHLRAENLRGRLRAKLADSRTRVKRPTRSH